MNAVEARGVGRTFGATHALRDVDLTVRAATVHALVGENGAGKSTLLGILAGRIARTTGTVEIFGWPGGGGDPRAARALGVAAIYQELTVVPELTARANVFLGRPLSRFGWESRQAMTTRYRELAERVGSAVPPVTPAGRLSVADQQLVEIMRALQTGARLMLFDEPSASLSAPERAELHRLIRRLRADGVTVVLVSHNLSEVLDLSDDITVFRDGRVVRSGPRGSWDREALVAAMLGGRSGPPGPVGPHPVRDGTPDGPVLVEVSELTVPGVLHDIAFSIHRGEILGVAGLVGSGRSSLLRALAGARPGATGTLRVGGVVHALPRGVRAARRLGFALVPEDRKTQGLVPGLSAARNIVVSEHSAVARAGWVRPALVRRAATTAAAPYAFAAGRIGEPVRRLSGGNQQKALLARWMHAPPTVLLADEPTRGIDIGAKAHVATGLRRFADDGHAVVMASSEIEELLVTCDRVLVLAGGAVTAQYRAGAATETAILDAAFARRDTP